MNSSNPQANLIAIIEASSHVLVDFDGPICQIFAGLPAESVASELLEILRHDGISIPSELQQDNDPLESLRFAATVSKKLADRVNSVLSAAELEAVDSATPTPGSGEFIVACRETDRSVGVVSNNFRGAVERYLHAHGLAEHVDHVSARTRSDPSLLKPNPHLLLSSIREFGGKSENFVLVGDSVSDIEAARSANVRHIGYANKPGKLQRLTDAGATTVITSLADLTGAVLTSTAIRPA